LKLMTTILTKNGGQYMVGKGVSWIILRSYNFELGHYLKHKIWVTIYTSFSHNPQITWADIGVSMIIEMMSDKDPTLLTKCPPLGDLMKRVNSQPRIKAWIEKRPKTDM
jgi:hypothetical protein